MVLSTPWVHNSVSWGCPNGRKDKGKDNFGKGKGGYELLLNHCGAYLLVSPLQNRSSLRRGAVQLQRALKRNLGASLG